MSPLSMSGISVSSLSPCLAAMSQFKNRATVGGSQLMRGILVLMGILALLVVPGMAQAFTSEELLDELGTIPGVNVV